MARRLTAIQQRLLGFLRAETAAGRPFPSTTQIVEHMGWESRRRTAIDVLQTLLVKGYVRGVGEWKLGRGARQWELTDKGLNDDDEVNHAA